MTHEFRAIYENGVLRPIDPLSLPEHDVVTVVVRSENCPVSHARDAAEQKRALLAALEEANRLPLESPDDGFSGADHDLVLYGWKK
jgi:predicted DNA-binding antitoxin AbrB/MazE fold protein